MPRLLISAAAILICGQAAAYDPDKQVEMWRGLVVAEEDRCSPYKGRDYAYSPHLELMLYRRDRGVSPYDGVRYNNPRATQIEHVVARSEAHDSGMCARGNAEKRKFANDMLNLALANPVINREKSGKDAAEWLPEKHKCWFAAVVVLVRQRYHLTVDRAEADALDDVLHGCFGIAVSV